MRHTAEFFSMKTAGRHKSLRNWPQMSQDLYRIVFDPSNWERLGWRQHMRLSNWTARAGAKPKLNPGWRENQF